MIKPFFPQQVFVEENALEYPLGRRLKSYFAKKDVPVTIIESHNTFKIPSAATEKELFSLVKEMLVIGVKKDLSLVSCRPSANYRLIFGTSCPGKCQYCYLASTLGHRVYLRIYVNIEEILKAVEKVLMRNKDQIITFEASSSSDPIPTEHLTGNLARTIEFFGRRSNGMLRVVSKFHFVDNLLDLHHKGATRFRFSVNAPEIVKEFEKNTSPLELRLQAAQKISKADYPLGFIIAPLMIFPGWQRSYEDLFFQLRNYIDRDQPVSFELIMYRFTRRARELIRKRFPQTNLEMDLSRRKHKGFGKYIYPEKEAEKLKGYLSQLIIKNFPAAHIEYFT